MQNTDMGNNNLKLQNVLNWKKFNLRNRVQQAQICSQGVQGVIHLIYQKGSHFSMNGTKYGRGGRVVGGLGGK